MRRSWRRWRSNVRVMGIDCGSERTGYGVIDSDGARHCMVMAGVIRTSPKQAFDKRLAEIAAGLRRVMIECRPQAASVEEVFHAVNVKTALKLAHVRGVALLVVAEASIELAEYSPLSIKTSVVGYGRAEKSQVRMMVHSLLRLDAAGESAVESEDACDALAAAICHATHSRFRALAV